MITRSMDGEYTSTTALVAEICRDDTTFGEWPTGSACATGAPAQIIIAGAAAIPAATERAILGGESAVLRCRCVRITASLHGKSFPRLTIRSQNRTVCLCRISLSLPAVIR